MLTTKYRIIFATPARLTHTEDVEFSCSNPMLAARGYVNEVIADGSFGFVSAQVFPAETVPLFTAGAAVKGCGSAGVESKLFNSYRLSAGPGPVDQIGAPKSDKFNTPDSGWISHITWERFNSSIGVHFASPRKGYIVYESDYETYLNYKTWVEMGNSAGGYYNSNIKGLPVLKSK